MPEALRPPDCFQGARTEERSEWLGASDDTDFDRLRRQIGGSVPMIIRTDQPRQPVEGMLNLTLKKPSEPVDHWPMKDRYLQ